MRYKEPKRTINYQSRVNRLVLALGKQGFSVKCITREVNNQLMRDKMSECQVYYRLRHQGILLTDFRNGKSAKALQQISKITVRLWTKPKSKTG